MSEPRRTVGPVAVVGLNMGGPLDLDGVRPFLRALFADRKLVRLPWLLRPVQGLLARWVAWRRSPRVRGMYSHIGGRSPLLETSRDQVAAVCAQLAAAGLPSRPFVAMRYASVRAAEMARAVAQARPAQIVLLSLYPQYSPATGGSSIDDARAALVAEASLRDTPLVVIERFGNLAGYVRATAQMVLEAAEGLDMNAAQVLFSAHGMPESYGRSGDPYERELRETFAAVRALLPAAWHVSLAFQSRVGPARWLGPATIDRVRELGRAGTQRLVLVPLAFVSDHVETLYELDVEVAHAARAAGISEVRRVAALNTHPVFVAALAELVREKCAAASASHETVGSAALRDADCKPVLA